LPGVREWECMTVDELGKRGAILTRTWESKMEIPM
jgi:hypothetical protein